MCIPCRRNWRQLRNHWETTCLLNNCNRWSWYSSYLQRQAHERSLRQSLNEANEKLHIAEQVQQEQTVKIDELTSSLNDQTNSAAECRAQIEQLQHQLQERDAAMASLQEEVNSRQDEISRHQWYLGERDADIVRLKETLAVRDGELSRMQHELDKQHEIMNGSSRNT